MRHKVNATLREENTEKVDCELLPNPCSWRQGFGFAVSASVRPELLDWSSCYVKRVRKDVR